MYIQNKFGFCHPLKFQGWFREGLSAHEKCCGLKPRPKWCYLAPLQYARWTRPCLCRLVRQIWFLVLVWPTCRHWILPKQFTWAWAKFANETSQHILNHQFLTQFFFKKITESENGGFEPPLSFYKYLEALFWSNFRSILISQDVWRCFLWRVYG